MKKPLVIFTLSLGLVGSVSAATVAPDRTAAKNVGTGLSSGAQTVNASAAKATAEPATASKGHKEKGIK